MSPKKRLDDAEMDSTDTTDSVSPSVDPPVFTKPPKVGMTPEELEQAITLVRSRDCSVDFSLDEATGQLDVHFVSMSRSRVVLRVVGAFTDGSELRPG